MGLSVLLVCCRIAVRLSYAHLCQGRLRQGVHLTRARYNGAVHCASLAMRLVHCRTVVRLQQMQAMLRCWQGCSSYPPWQQRSSLTRCCRGARPP